ncbi:MULTISPECIES: DUF5994 family protein [unclassified Nocardioides]|jgi:hypothetical protein|uniref:DUF5994 family protein n=1 Tax=unclassified Nocardioides TaxID=2615069 RepID=UPI0007032250|nr:MULTISPECIES: DUF5994 family protein [unclassified Nocardioides]KRC53017.1 hypothetical protein ASE19_11535 [Nocardioides sp. Root79]KRC72546.1 hypothetical protein ASE20_08065 [Nocardioides sp. Root240]
MTTSTTTVTRQPAQRAPLRLAAHHGSRLHPLDGAWWPQSRDLQVECADLVDHFPDGIGRIARLLFSPPDWDLPWSADGTGTYPRKVSVGRGPVKVGWFPHDDTHVMVLVLSTGERLHVLVVPSATDQRAALALMERAADERNTQDATALLALITTPAHPWTERDQRGLLLDYSVWDDEGGSIPRSAE